MKNRKYTLQKDFVFLTVSMFIIVCLWIGFNIYDAYVTTTINDILQLQIIPINGKFDLETIEKLKKRNVVQPDYAEVIASDEAYLPEPTETIPSIQDDVLLPTPESATAEAIPAPITTTPTEGSL